MSTPSLRRPLHGLVLGVVLAALLAAVLVTTLLSSGGVPALLVFPALALAAEAYGTRLYGALPVSLSTVAVLGAACAGAPRAALLAAAVAAVATTVRSGSRRLEQHAFNPAAAVTCAFVAVLLVQPFVDASAVVLLAAGVVAGACYLAADNALVAAAIALDQQRPVRAVLREDLAFRLPVVATYGALGGLLGVLWTQAPVWGLVAVVVPAALHHRVRTVPVAAPADLVVDLTDEALVAPVPTLEDLIAVRVSEEVDPQHVRAVAAALRELTAPLPEGYGRSIDSALAEVAQHSGTAFQPPVVAAAQALPRQRLAEVLAIAEPVHS